MTRKIYPFIMLLLVFILAACASSAEEADPSSGETTVRETPLELQLMLGSVMLDETAYAIDSQQAAELLPLWKVLSNLTGSDTAAQAEVDAVIASIQDTMTPEQMAEIEAMALTNADMSEVSEKLGIEIGGGGRFGEMTPEMQATIEAMRESGERPPEGFGPGGGMGQGGGQGPGGGDTGISPEMRETAMAERGSNLGRGFGINTQLLEAIIAFLEAK
ncbi:MAG: hypothetical protein MUO62_07420 [Anaerolineales bacterium]|nr:hypothetical protein [Anaerolineales bacterium]